MIDHWWQTETGWPIAANCLGHRAAAGRSRIADARRARLGRARPRRRRDEARRARSARSCVKLPMPPGLVADALERRGALPRVVPRRLPRLLQDGRRRLHRRGRLRLRDGPHRRHDQRRRSPPLDRRDGGGAGVAPGRRRVRSDRRHRRAEGPAAARLRSSSRRASNVRDGEIAREVVQMVRERIGPVAAFKTASSSSACRRRGRARSCAGRCGGSPTARSTRRPRRSTTRRSSTRSGTPCRPLGMTGSRPARLQRLVLTALTRTSELEEVGFRRTAKQGTCRSRRSPTR